MKNQTDEKLIEQIGRGDTKAFESLMLKHKNKVYGFCVKLLGDLKRAEDMSQETWIRVVQGAPQFVPRAQVSTWILQIARNLCLNEIRKASWEEELPEASAHQLPDPEPSLEQALIAAEDQKKIQKFIQELPEKQRVILTLWLSGERQQSEVAAELKMSVGAVKVQLHRIKEKLTALQKASS